ACACGIGGGVFLNVHASKTCLRYTGWEHSVTIEQAGQDPEKIAGEPDIFALEDAQFLKAVSTGDRSLIRCDYPDGLKTAELALAANESMATGKAVKLSG
ncbi:MAG TPA: hypothetical protein VFJ58_00960, partial [Armatimonadota bacterium]|nr:hypothetical protein [Armatimonadota bacterium]